MFDKDFRIENMIFKPRDERLLNDPNFTIITKEFLEEIYYFEKVARKLTIEYKDKRYGLDDLCWTAFAKGNCVTQSPMNYWLNDIETLKNDDDLQSTINCYKTVGKAQTIACMDANKIPVQEKSVFGGILRTKQTSPRCGLGNGMASPCERSTISAKTMLVTYLLRENSITSDKAEAWEADAIEPLIKRFNENTDTKFLQEYIPDIETKPLNLHITYMLQRTINDELKAETQQNYIIIIISYIIMFVYISLSLGKFYNCVRSNILLSLTGIIFISGAVFVGYCFCGFLGIKASLISMEVIPFLVLAIGVDNMFLIYHSVYRVPSDNVETKVGVGLRNIGTSITLSTLTQVLTFCIGINMAIPALRTFCITAAFALSVNYIIQISVYPALLAIDLRRKMTGYADVLPFLKTNDQVNIKNTEEGSLSNFFAKYWYNMIKLKTFKIVVLAICVALFAFSFLAVYKLPVGLDQQLATLKDDNLYRYFGNVKNYIEQGPMSSIIIEKADYSNMDMFDALDRLVELLSKRDNLTVPPFRVWYRGVINLANARYIDSICNVCFKGVDPDELIGDFNKLTRYFLTIDLNHPCCSQYGMCGGQFYEDVIFKGVI